MKKKSIIFFLLIIGFSLFLSSITSCSDGEEGEGCDFQLGHGPYFESDQCEEGLLCVYDPVRFKRFQNRKGCVSPRKLGDQCEYEVQCEGATFCDKRTEPSMCREYLSEDEVCGVCGNRLHCNAGFDPPLCKFSLPESSPCGHHSDCKQTPEEQLECRKNVCRKYKSAKP